MAKMKGKAHGEGAGRDGAAERLVTLAKEGKIDELTELLASLTHASAPADALAQSFYYAMQRKRDLKLVDLLLAKGLDPNLQLARFTPLGAAALFGDPEFVESLIERDCDVNVAAADGTTPLMACCFRGAKNGSERVRGACVSVARLLIAKGADVNRRNVAGNTALDLACDNVLGPWREMISLLLKSGTRLDLCKDAGSWCVTQAAGYTNHEPLQLMLEHGADPNSRDLTGNTALIYAAARADLPMVQLLLRSGARVDIRDRDGLAALDIAVRNGHGANSELVSLLRCGPREGDNTTEEPRQSDETHSAGRSDTDQRPHSVAPRLKKRRSGVIKFPDILGIYRLDAENTAVVMAKEISGRFPTAPGYEKYEQAMVKHWSGGAEAPAINGIRLTVEPHQIILTSSEGENEVYRAKRAWRDQDRRFVELDCGGTPMTFEIKVVGESGIQLSCECHEIGDLAWKRV